MKELAAEGVPVAALESRPEPDRAQNYYIQVFYELVDSRRFTHGQPVSIPISEILSYCQMFYIDSLEERDRLVKAIRVLDNTYLKVSADQAKEAENRAESQVPEG